MLSTQCVKREGSLKWILMHKLQGDLEPQSCKRQWKVQNPTQKMLGFNLLCVSGVLVSFRDSVILSLMSEEN